MSRHRKRSTADMIKLDIRDVPGLDGVAGVSLAVLGMTAQEIRIERTPCRFGGFRPWWVCPRCARRVGVLWGDSVGFACRHCQKLNYDSTRTTKSARPFHKADKLRKRLGWPAGIATGFGGKPAGMHWVTFQRLLAELHRCTLEAMRVTERRSNRIVQRVSQWRDRAG